jgi:hypothetical protein
MSIVDANIGLLLSDPISIETWLWYDTDGALPSNSNLPIGAVVGGVVGGMTVTIFAAYLIFLIFRKKPPVKYPQFGRKYEGM